MSVQGYYRPVRVMDAYSSGMLSMSEEERRISQASWSPHDVVKRVNRVELVIHDDDDDVDMLN